MFRVWAPHAKSVSVIGAFNETAWALMIETTLVAGLASVLTSVAGIPEVKEGE